MEKTAFIEKTGGPEVIQWRDEELPPPGPGEVRMRHHAVGLNYIDTYHRSGLYPIDLPASWAPKRRAWSRRWARA